jgi:amino acid permease
VAAFTRVVGGASGLMVALIIGSLILVMNTSMAGSCRALRGIAADGMTIRGLEPLNRFGVPGRALLVDLVVQDGVRLRLRELE